MAEKLKNFFAKKKDSKFKGKGHKLTDNPPSVQPKPSASPHIPPTEDARQAGLAALARLANTTGSSKTPTSSFAYQHGKLDVAVSSSSQPTDGSKLTDSLAVHGVYFKCPFIGQEILPKKEWKDRIRQFLYEQLELDKGFNSCLMIHTLNKNKEKVSVCIDTLCTYLSNIITYPEDDKYKKIRLSNKIFQEKVAKIEGSIEYLFSAGFEKVVMDEENFFVYNKEPDIQHLEMLIDSLRMAQPITLELDRNLRVLLPDQAASMLELPIEFYSLSVSELKREQQQRTDSLEASMQLRTKAMREKEEQRELKKYNYTLIRVRFPDGLFLQGTFSVYERLSAVRNFVKECLFKENSFELRTALGKTLSCEDDDKTLFDMKLVPAVLLTFNWNLSSTCTPPNSYLHPDLMVLVETIS